MARCTPRCLAAPVLLALCLAACSDDVSSSGATVQATGSSSGAGTGTEAASTAPGSTTADSPGELPTTGSGLTEDGTTTTSGAGEPSTSDTTTGDTTGDGTSDTTAGTTTDDGDSTGAGEPPPPVDVCAKQDKAPPAVDPPGPTNDDPKFIQVYVNNVENLKVADEQCAGDWTDLIYYMKTIDPAPDVFLVQQVSNTAQLDVLVERMTDELPDAYDGVIADGDPWNQLSPCGKEKAKQTNAVIFRKGRFTRVGDKHVWQAWAKKAGKCVRNTQARTRSVMIKLHDKIADKHVTVASVHWSTSQDDGEDPACAAKNIVEVDEKLHRKGYEADLLVFGGDFNEPDRQADNDSRPWYKKANGDEGGGLNWRDPIYRACQAADKLHVCLDDNWTIGSERRIDAVFGQDGEGCRARTRRAHTISFDEGDAAAKKIVGSDDPLNYSDHRAVRAEFYYR